ncbi:hypothetical protein MMC12_002800 [Toensbergia leucococca]|nr:hypothetical protein [Toensbergia leucococca]
MYCWDCNRGEYVLTGTIPTPSTSSNQTIYAHTPDPTAPLGSFENPYPGPLAYLINPDQSSSTTIFPSSSEYLSAPENPPPQPSAFEQPMTQIRHQYNPQVQEQQARLDDFQHQQQARFDQLHQYPVPLTQHPHPPQAPQTPSNSQSIPSPRPQRRVRFALDTPPTPDLPPPIPPHPPAPDAQSQTAQPPGLSEEAYPPWPDCDLCNEKPVFEQLGTLGLCRGCFAEAVVAEMKAWRER